MTQNVADSSSGRSAPPVVLLVGSRRMAKLAEALKQISPRARYILAETARAGEAALSEANVVILG